MPGIGEIFIEIYCNNEVKRIRIVSHSGFELLITTFLQDLNYISSGINVAYFKVYIVDDFNIHLLQYQDIKFNC